MVVVSRKRRIAVVKIWRCFN